MFGFEQARIDGCKNRHYLNRLKHIKTLGLLHHGARKMVNVDHELTDFLSPAVFRSEFPH